MRDPDEDLLLLCDSVEVATVAETFIVAETVMRPETSRDLLREIGGQADALCDDETEPDHSVPREVMETEVWLFNEREFVVLVTDREKETDMRDGVIVAVASSKADMDSVAVVPDREKDSVPRDGVKFNANDNDESETDLVLVQEGECETDWREREKDDVLCVLRQ